MKTLKNAGSIMLVAALVLAGPAAWANDGDKGHDFDPAKKVEKMKKQLNLTDDQAAKIQAIFEKKKAEKEAAREAAKKAWEESRQQTHNEISAILTEEQRVKFEENAAKMKEKHKEKKADKDRSHDNG